MKSHKLTLAFAALLAHSIVLLGQDPPNLQNGIPPQGSFDGSSADTVNLMNGNLALHIPLPVVVPQRGKAAIKYYLVVNAKTWQAVAGNAGLGTQNQWYPTSACTTQPPTATGPCGQGYVFVTTASFGMSRIYQSVFVEGQGTTYSVSAPDTVSTWDGASHPLFGASETMDTSGYQVQISGSNAQGLPYSATIIDREGTQYIGNFMQDGSTCSTDTSGIPGNTTTTTTCGEHFAVSTVEDANGNVLSAPLGIPDIASPNTNGPTVATHLASGSESTGCVTSFGTPWVGYLSYPAPNGQTNQIKLCFATYPQLSTSFSPSGIHQFQDVYSGHAFPGNWRQPVYLTNVILPDNTQWSIAYDSYGEITSLGTPTGASIQYFWTEGQFPVSSQYDITSVSRAVHSRSLIDVNGHVFTWSYQWGAVASDGTMTHTVTDPVGNDTTHKFSPIEAIPQLYHTNYKETTTVVFQGSGGSRTPLQQVDINWLIKNDGGLGVPTDAQTTLTASGKVSLVHTDYDPTSPTLGLAVATKSYDWGQGVPGALLREVDTVYQWQKDSRYLTANMIDLPASTIIVSPVGAANIKSSCPVGGAGTTKACMAEVDYDYDEPTYLTNYETAVGALPAGTHLAAPNPVRGNLTTTRRWLNTGGSVDSHTNWYDTGEVYKTIDPLLHATIHSYDLAYNGALPTKTCNPKNQCVSATYDVNTGLLTSFTDANGSYPASGATQGDPAHTAVYGYDFMRRLTSAVSPPDANGNSLQTTFGYPDAITVHRLMSITTGLNDSLTTYYDGLGRVASTQHATPNGNVTVNSTFDGLGHVTSVTNPYLTTADSTYGVLQTQYDGLGRPTITTEQDGSVKFVDYSGGNCVVSTDEAGSQRKSCSDALGRLVEVDEPNPNAAASYASGTVTINGNEQSNPQAGAAGSGTVTIGGSEGSSQSCTDPLPPRQPVCFTVWDIGSVNITVNGYSKTTGFGNQNTTASSVAAALASAFHNDSSSPVDAWCSDSLCTNPVITLTARTQGVATNYSLSAGPSASSGSDFYATASGANLTGGRDATSNPDTGTVTITVNGTNYTTAYGGGDNSGTIASRLAGLISAGSYANGSYSGNVVTLTSKTAGPGGDYSLAASYSYDSAHFAGPSFTTSPSGISLTGGYNAGDPSNNPYVTLYQYDSLGNLLRVDQKGSAPGDSTQWRTRLFAYDSLSRLTQAANPESGTITYSYDPAGNLLQKTSPAPNQTGSATQTISYCYDELNRITGRAYSAQTCQGTQLPAGTAVVSYVYDQGPNSNGRLTSITDQAGALTYSYDLLGRMVTQQRTLSGTTKTIGYDYNVDGSVKALHYPSGRVVNYTYDSAGRLIAAIDGNGTQYVSNATYYPSGAEYQRFMPTIYFRTDVNKRLQINGFYADNGQVTSYYMSKSYGMNDGHNNGDLLSITNNKDSNRTQTYTYDVLNRLTSGWSQGNTGATSWGDNYAIDAWGNLQVSPMAGKAGGGNFANASDGNNHVIGFGYDAAGNLTNYTASGQYVYDSENRLSSTAGISYTYDGDGQRVLKSQGGLPTKNYWYGNGVILAEGDGTANITAEYIFFSGARVARIDLANNSVHYYLSDHLKSTSMVVTASGAIEEESDYSAFGTEFPITSGPNRYKYVGKENDLESNLDYFDARFYGSFIGRFLSADPLGGHQEDPQTLNKYGYVRNIPTVLSDATGLDFTLDCGDESTTCQNGVAGRTVSLGNGNWQFQATVVGNDEQGNLVDKTTNTGSYSASVTGGGVQFTQAGSNQSSMGTFINGTSPTVIQNPAHFPGFTFTFTYSNMAGGVNAGGTFTYAGTYPQAESALVKTGFIQYSGDDTNIFHASGYDYNAVDFRTPGQEGTGANSGHVTVEEPKVSVGQWGMRVTDPSVAPTTGTLHLGEHNPFSYNREGFWPHTGEVIRTLIQMGHPQRYGPFIFRP